MKKVNLLLEVKILEKFFIEINWKMGDMPNKFMILAERIARQDFECINWLLLARHN